MRFDPSFHCVPHPAVLLAFHVPALPLCRYPSFRIQDAEEKIKARQELVKGALADKLNLLVKLVVRASSWLA